MAVNQSRSRRAELHIGAGDATYSSGSPDRGGVVENESVDPLSYLDSRQGVASKAAAAARRALRGVIR